MKITSIRTHKITSQESDLYKILDRYLPQLKEECIVAITSKIVSICEGNIVPKESTDKKKLIQAEADVILGSKNAQRYVITMKNGVLLPTAGVDPSDDMYIMLPKQAQKTAKVTAQYLRKKHKLHHLGVVITDSKSTILRRGTLGYAVGYSGFCGLKNYRNTADKFLAQQKRQKLSNRVDDLAAAAVAVMGEGKEQTPLALIEEIPFITFHTDSPTKIELKCLFVKPEEDLFIASLSKLGHK